MCCTRCTDCWPKKLLMSWRMWIVGVYIHVSSPPPQKKNSGVHSCGQPTEKYGKNKKTLTLPKVVMCGPQVW